MPESVRVAAVQLGGAGEDLEANVEAAHAGVRQAAATGARLILLPELATLPYFCGLPGGARAAWAEPVPGPLTDGFAALCRELGVVVALPLYARDDDGHARNAVVILDHDGRIVPAVDAEGGIHPCSHKLHLPVGDEPRPGFDEAAHFTAGGHLGLHDVLGLRLGVLICFDRRFPECWRALRGLGADLVLVPVAGDGGDPPDFQLAELRTHARENGLAAVLAAPAGADEVGGQRIDNTGGSCVVDAAGETLAVREAAPGSGIVTARVDPAHTAATRARVPYFERRRLDLFPAWKATGADVDGRARVLR